MISLWGTSNCRRNKTFRRCQEEEEGVVEVLMEVMEEDELAVGKTVVVVIGQRLFLLGNPKWSLRAKSTTLRKATAPMMAASTTMTKGSRQHCSRW
jgi:hypothetical protein